MIFPRFLGWFRAWGAVGLGLWLGGCAGSTAEQGEIDDVRTEMKSIRDQQTEQARRIAALEARIASSTPAEASKVEAPARRPMRVPGDLQVVYLAPPPLELKDSPRAARRLPDDPRHAPRLATETPLKEPPKAESETGDSAGDAAFSAAEAAPDPIEPLERFSRAYPDHAKADNALYEAGVLRERRGDRHGAAQDYREVVRAHPAGDVVLDALLHLAACDQKLARAPEARAALHRLIDQFPGTAQAQAAQVRLDQLGP